MAPLTIAERAAAGQIQSVQGLTKDEQKELIIWAKQQGMSYKAIKARWGFTDKEDNLRQIYLHRPNHNPPRVPVFTATDDNLLHQAVKLYATGPLDQERSLDGIWNAVKAYIQKNGGTTTAHVATLKARWLASQDGPLPPGPWQPRGRRNPPVLRLRDPSGAAPGPQITGQAPLARTFPVLRLRDTPQGNTTLPSWNDSEYPQLSEEEMKEVLGDEEAEDLDQEKEADDEGSSGDTTEDPPRPGLRPRKG
ncbi:hypothetical protein Daus18300_011881 [Diaporthe australafricana]|uniref:Uncharacterized protein n=1 Tax=Diaporthe australafricana TaxID=127596 RepID=A0ABR3W4X3_9PEZI